MTERHKGTPLRLDETPTEMVVRGFLIDEGNNDIYIYLGDKPPLSVIVPYSKPLHKSLSKGRYTLKGQPFKISKMIGGEEDSGQGDGNGDGEGEGDEDSLSTESEGWMIEIPLPGFMGKK